MREFLWENLEKEYKIYRFTKEKKEEISLIIDRTFFLRVKHLHCHKQRREKEEKIGFPEISRFLKTIHDASHLSHFCPGWYNSSRLFQGIV